MTGSQALRRAQDGPVGAASQSRGGESLLGHVRFVCAMAVSAAAFWHVGWWIVKPSDPAGAVSLLMVDQGVVAMAELLGMAVVCSGLAVAICGAGAADRGPLAIAVGLATLGLRGSQLDMLLLYRLNPPIGTQSPIDPFPTTAMMAECWLWLAMIAVGFVVGRWVESWFGSPERRPTENRLLADYSPDVRHGVGAVIVASLVAWSILSVSVGGKDAPMLKGQVYFGVGFAFLVAGLVAHWFFQTASRLWSLIVVAVVASGAYLFGGPDQEAVNHARETGTYLTLNPIARPLPLEYAALGALGALWERDWMRLLRSLLGMNPEEPGGDGRSS